MEHHFVKRAGKKEFFTCVIVWKQASDYQIRFCNESYRRNVYFISLPTTQ